jgi:glycopeptide antibiotics resistance protein
MTTGLNVYKLIGVKKFIPGIAWFFLTLIAISIPGYDLPKMGAWFEQISFDKLIHTGLFGMLAVLLMYPFSVTALAKKHKLNWYIKIALATIIWGLAAELIQKYFIPRRSFDIVDFIANSLGALLALLYFKIRLNKKQ